MLSKDRLLHPATVIATVALLVALSGAGYAANKIGTAQLKNNAVTTPKIKNNAVSTAKIRANAVNSARLAPGAVRAADLGAGAVVGAALADGAVTGAKLGPGAVAGGNLANGAVTDAKLGPNAVTGAKIAGATITAANIAPGQVVKGNGELVSGRLTLGVNTAASLLLSLPGLATVQVSCSATGEVQTIVNNISGALLDVTAAGQATGPSPIVVATTLSSGAAALLLPAAAQNVTWQLSSGTSAAPRVATVTTGAFGGNPAGCVAAGQAVTTG
jgi:trimeric autotransporter adhesin